MVLLVVISIMIVTQLKHLKESKDNAIIKQLAHHSLESDELTVLVIFLNRPYQGSYNLQEYKQLHIMNYY